MLGLLHAQALILMPPTKHNGFQLKWSLLCQPQIIWNIWHIWHMFYSLVKKTEAPIQRSKLSKKRTTVKIQDCCSCSLSAKSPLQGSVRQHAYVFKHLHNNSNSVVTDEILSRFFSSNNPKLAGLIKLSWVNLWEDKRELGAQRLHVARRALHWGVSTALSHVGHSYFVFIFCFFSQSIWGDR